MTPKKTVLVRVYAFACAGRCETTLRMISNTMRPTSPIARFKPVLFPLIEQIRSRRAEIDNLRASIPILLHQRAPFAVIRVAHADAAAYDAPSLIRSVITLVAHAHERRRTHVRITHHAFTVACVPFASRRPSSVVFVSRRRPSGVSRLASRALARSRALSRTHTSRTGARRRCPASFCT